MPSWEGSEDAAPIEFDGIVAWLEPNTKAQTLGTLRIDSGLHMLERTISD